MSIAGQYPRLTGLCLMLLALALLIAPATYHRIVERGGDSPDLLDYITRIIELALLPFALGLGIDLYLAAKTMTSARFSLLAGVMTTGGALVCWYGWEMYQPHRPEQEGAVSDNKNSTRASSRHSTTLSDKIEHVLTETRVVLPGVQALLGFQLTITLLVSFDQLPAWSKYVHLSSLAFIAVRIVLLMMLVAYHRIVEHGANTQRFHSFVLA
jgi:Family of unknown function (DUF6328)